MTSSGTFTRPLLSPEQLLAAIVEKWTPIMESSCDDDPVVGGPMKAILPERYAECAQALETVERRAFVQHKKANEVIGIVAAERKKFEPQ